ncbi:MAG: hypothetical protein CMN86_20945 [Stappia sp.]|nr:hypothetical protein [Stappia sp.]
MTARTASPLATLARRLRTGAALPLAVALLAGAAATPAEAHCSISDKVETCSGDLTGGPILHNEGQVEKLTISGLTSDFTNTSGDSTQALISIVTMNTIDSLTQGNGVEATISLDDGYGLYSAVGIQMGSVGDMGSKGNDVSHFDKHATGGTGSNGGVANNVTLTFKQNSNKGLIRLLESKGGDENSFGVSVIATGGTGGTGGQAHSSGGLRDAEGGAGGNGGAGGTVNVTMTDDHRLEYEGAGIGFVAGSLGGNGGTGGKGKLDTWGDQNSAYGGQGGNGADGGTVNFLADSTGNTITTSGTYGVFIASVGGDGGKGGEAEYGHTHPGKGGNAGNGGTVNVTLSAAVSSTKIGETYGVYVKSAGGFAGDSGDGSGGITDHASKPGEPGAAGDVTLTMTNSSIDNAMTGGGASSDVQSYGILVQSIGGMGGASGKATEGIATYGAKGGSGGAGASATVNLTSTSVTMHGDYGTGVLVQSVGGGGGVAGKTGGVVAMSASGGAGGQGGKVGGTLKNLSVDTDGNHSYGIQLQSVGGGGGASGSAGGVVAVGGKSGGLGGDADTVSITVDNTNVTTKGDHSVGLSLASIGGGGGQASSSSGPMAIGADGGGAGNGGNVTLTGQGFGIQSSTSGRHSDAVSLKSVGGGGGDGAGTFELFGNFSSHVGSSGGAGGSGGDISYTGTDYDNLLTSGHHSHGVSLLSIGGGGGTGGNIITISLGAELNNVQTANVGGSSSNINHGGAIKDTTIAGYISTKGYSSYGVLAASVGGGGGSVGSSYDFTVGTKFGSSSNLGSSLGSGYNTGGDGGTVTLTSNATIYTEGAHSSGILAASIGGGGGAMGNVIDGTVGVEMPNWSSLAGAQSGGGGNGGDVSVTLANVAMDGGMTNGDITTTGDMALGVLAMSVSGGGGQTGTTVTAGVDTDIGTVTYGQTGGAAGKAGAVSVTSAVNVSTEGNLSAVIAALSIGNSGGHGGLVVNGNISVAEVNFTQGGAGGNSGTAGTVDVTNNGTLSSKGDWAPGILALSVSGSGGAGGTTVAGNLAMASFGAAIGGGGGDGGTASKVTVTNTGKIVTEGEYSAGILAASIGGHGGTAGTTVNGNLTAGEAAVSGTVTLGGDGGSGGQAGAVEISNKKGAVVLTAEKYATGILGLSLGGSGGVGGSNYSLAGAGGEYSASINASFGGKGGGSGKANTVTITNDGIVGTQKVFADGILALSIGGNGGKGGDSYAISADYSTSGSFDASYTMGGEGGSGATGGNVTVNNTGIVAAAASSAAGIRALSIGGNGGVGGGGVAVFGTAGNNTGGDSKSLAVKGEVGGHGGTGMNAGTVTVKNSGTITADICSVINLSSCTTTSGVSGSGDDDDKKFDPSKFFTSVGISAQSVGGGGGAGGDAGSYAVGYTYTPKNIEEAKSFSLEITLGGSGGAGGDGNTVNVGNTGTIRTAGLASYGIFAQSVGGGGGSGGNGSPGLEGWLADIYEDYEKINQVIESYKTIMNTYHKEWKEIFLESWKFNMGGEGGGAGKGGNVIVTNNGTIITDGDSATAIYAQSVGGGGGAGGDGSMGGITSIALSGSADAGSHGGTVTVDNYGKIVTSGDGAMGIYAQSVGGGGGTAGDVEGSIIEEIDSLAEVVGYNIFGGTGAGAGKGGDGGDVTVNLHQGGSITTTGANAHAIWVQSVGGGGGAAGWYGLGDDKAHDVIGSNGAEGKGGLAKVTVDGTIDVSGEGAHGIFVQSAAGGVSDFGSGGAEINVNGTITARGKQSRAILVHTADTASKDSEMGVANITIGKDGYVRTTDEEAHSTIGILGGHSVYNDDHSINLSNKLTNHGKLYSNAYVVQTDGAHAFQLENDGELHGRLDFGSTSTVRNAVTNLAGGTMFLGHSNLGTSEYSTFENSGTMKAGWTNDTRRSIITSGGTFTQTSTGTLLFDVSKDETKAGSFTLDFDKGGSLDGQLAFNFEGALSNGANGSFDVATLKAGDGSSFDTSKLGVRSGGAVAYTWSKANQSDGDHLTLGYTVDYSGDSTGATLSENARGFGQYFAGVVGQSGGMTAEQREALDFLGVRILNAGDSRELAGVYEEQILEEAAMGVSKALSTTQAVHTLLQSCPVLDPTDPQGFYRQRDCAWFEALGGKTHQDATSTKASSDESVYGFAGAIQKEIADDLFLEVGGQLEMVTLTGNGFKQDGTRVSGGMALKQEVGNLTFASSVAGGFYDLDHSRIYNGAGGLATATGDVKGGFVSAEARIEAVFEAHGFYAKPKAALGISHVWQNAFTEQGTGGFNWHTNAITHTAVTARPSFEFGHAFQWGSSAAVAYLRAGLTAELTNPDVSVTTRLAGAGAGLGNLDLNVGNDRFTGDLAAGLSVDVSERFNLSVLGQTSFSGSSYGYGGYARASLKF